MTNQEVKVTCSKCGKKYEATIKAGLRPRDFLKPRMCPECKQEINMSGATKVRINK